jgi:putative ABC transport system permease protein
MFFRKRRDEDLDAELRSHLSMAARDRVDRGEAPTDADRNARREFGNLPLIGETTRDMWTWSWLDRLAQDLRYAARVLRRAPGFTAVAVLTLALGIGATTALFSAIEAVLLRPLPYADPDRLVVITRPSPKDPDGRPFTPEVSAWLAESHSFSGLAVTNDQQFNLTRAAEPERIIAALVNADFLRTLGVQPYLGRDFTPEQDRSGNTRFVLLAYELWQRQFHSDPACIGRTAVLNDTPYVITGVLPRGFRFPIGYHPDALVPGGYSSPPEWSAQAYGILQVIGRRREGMAPEQSAAELSSILSRHQADYPQFLADKAQGSRIRFVPLAEQMNGPIRRPLLVLWCAVTLILLLICTNLAGLQLARASARTSELALRAALGAARGRLIRLMLTESLLVALCGGTLGIGGAFWLVNLLRRLEALQLPAPDAVQVNGHVLLFGIALTLFSGILAGLAPALLASRPDLHDAMKIGSRSIARGWRGGTRSALVAAEVAMALVLLLGAGLLLRSMYRLITVPLGIEPTRVLSLRLRLPRERYRDDRGQAAFADELLRGVRALPGVERAATTSAVPLTGHNLGFSLRFEGEPDQSDSHRIGAAVMTVSPGYFATLGIPLLAGQELPDRPSGPPVAVVNRSFARRFYADGNAVGKRFGLGRGGDWVTITGIVGDVRQESPQHEPEPEIFLPNRQRPSNSVGLAVRSAVPPESLTAALRQEIHALDPDLPIYDISSMEDRITRATAPQRLELWLVGAFAALATILAALGVYGVIAYAVSQSTHEIGVRLALGAPAGRVQRAVIRKGMQLGLAGVALGLAGGWALTRYLATLLFETTPRDAATFASASAILLAIALLASWLPARRAARVDPATALRAQ